MFILSLTLCNRMYAVIQFLYPNSVEVQTDEDNSGEVLYSLDDSINALSDL